MSADPQTTSTPTEQSMAEPEPSSPARVVSSRRSMLRTVAAGTAGAAVVAVVGARPAAAADGDPLNVGEVNTHTTQTSVKYDGPLQAASFNIEAGDETAGNATTLGNLFPGQGAALLAVASGNGLQTSGIVGWSKKPGGTGVVGFTGGMGAYGGEFFGGLAELRLRPGGDAPITSTVAHLVGELFEDATGALWLCVVAGTPGTWRQLAGPTTAGAFNPIVPQRVVDTRSAGGKLLADTERTVSVATALAGPEAVPIGATAISATVTVTQTEGTGGYVSVRPGGTVWAGTSSINWFGPGQDLATTAISGLGGDRQLVLRAGGAASHVIVDVTGFYR